MRCTAGRSRAACSWRFTRAKPKATVTSTTRPMIGARFMSIGSSARRARGRWWSGWLACASARLGLVEAGAELQLAGLVAEQAALLDEVLADPLLALDAH